MVRKRQGLKPAPKKAKKRSAEEEEEEEEEGEEEWANESGEESEEGSFEEEDLTEEVAHLKQDQNVPVAQLVPNLSTEEKSPKKSLQIEYSGDGLPEYPGLKKK